MRKILLLTALAVAVLAGDGRSQMTRPDTRPQLNKLSFLTGHFTTETTVHMGPNPDQTATGRGTAVLDWYLDSMYVFINTQEENAMLGKYKGFGILGYDQNTDTYTLTMYNNFGDQPHYTGTFSGDTLVMTTKIDMPNGSFAQKILWYKDGANVRLQVFNDMGQGPVEAVDQVSTPSQDK